VVFFLRGAFYQRGKPTFISTGAGAKLFAAHTELPSAEKVKMLQKVISATTSPHLTSAGFCCPIFPASHWSGSNCVAVPQRCGQGVNTGQWNVSRPTI